MPDLLADVKGQDALPIYGNPGHLARRLHQIAVSIFLSETGEFGITRELGSRVSAILNAARDESRRTCEVCGEPGSETGQSWIKTLCPDHAPPT